MTCIDNHLPVSFFMGIKKMSPKLYQYLNKLLSLNCGEKSHLESFRHIDDSLEIKLLDNKTQIKTKCILMHEALLQLVRLQTKQHIKQICQLCLINTGKVILKIVYVFIHHLNVTHKCNLEARIDFLIQQLKLQQKCKSQKKNQLLSMHIIRLKSILFPMQCLLTC